MKWIALLPVFLLLEGCVVTSNSEVVEYQQVVVPPSNEPLPAFYNRDDAVDVTTTTVNYY